jgi:UDP-arabinose 4-epimerase
MRGTYSVYSKFGAPSAVMHFAGYAYVGESVLDPIKYYATNISGTAKLLGVCGTFQCANIVVSSSCATYGRPVHVPLKEDDPQNPINPYGYSKLVVKRMLNDVGAAYGIRHVSLRYFNAAGAGPDGELGELHGSICSRSASPKYSMRITTK